MPSLEVNNPYFTAAMEGGASLEEKKRKEEGGEAFLLKESSTVLKSLHELPCVRRSGERMELSLALQHRRAGCGAGRAAAPPKTATSCPMCPHTPKSL